MSYDCLLACLFLFVWLWQTVPERGEKEGNWFVSTENGKWDPGCVITLRPREGVISGGRQHQRLLFLSFFHRRPPAAPIDVPAQERV